MPRNYNDRPARDAIMARFDLAESIWESGDGKTGEILHQLTAHDHDGQISFSADRTGIITFYADHKPVHQQENDDYFRSWFDGMQRKARGV